MHISNVAHFNLDRPKPTCATGEGEFVTLYSAKISSTTMFADKTLVFIVHLVLAAATEVQTSVQDRQTCRDLLPFKVCFAASQGGLCQFAQVATVCSATCASCKYGKVKVQSIFGCKIRLLGCGDSSLPICFALADAGLCPLPNVAVRFCRRSCKTC